MKFPEKVSEKGFDPDMRREFNAVVDYLRSLTPRSSTGAEVERGADGFTIRPKNTGDSTNNNQAPRWG